MKSAQTRPQSSRYFTWTKAGKGERVAGLALIWRPSLVATRKCAHCSRSPLRRRQVSANGGELSAVYREERTGPRTEAAKGTTRRQSNDTTDRRSLTGREWAVKRRVGGPGTPETSLFGLIRDQSLCLKLFRLASWRQVVALCRHASIFCVSGFY